MAYTDGYDKTSPNGSSPKSAGGTEKTNEQKGPGPEWAKQGK
jgi:hypothetical protein